jgi:hypothetical protein
MATLNHPRKAVARDGLLLSLGRVALEETKVRANANRHWAGDRRRAVPEPERPADTGRPLSIRAADRRKAIGLRDRAFARVGESVCHGNYLIGRQPGSAARL